MAIFEAKTIKSAYEYLKGLSMELMLFTLVVFTSILIVHAILVGQNHRQALIQEQRVKNSKAAIDYLRHHPRKFLPLKTSDSLDTQRV